MMKLGLTWVPFDEARHKIINVTAFFNPHIVTSLAAFPVAQTDVNHSVDDQFSKCFSYDAWPGRKQTPESDIFQKFAPFARKKRWLKAT